MLFLVICRDHPDSEDRRRDLMPQHGPHIRPLLKDFAVGGLIRQGGPTCGSAVVLQAESRETVEATFRADPYFGPVWHTVEVYEFEPLIGSWIGKTSFDKG
jgi:uncharacterized protein YciI